jgi:Flp pilus assembly CpaF family ATPase
MRPDRIVIGECRGGEALDMLQAMNTGHEGSLTTIHANTPRDGLGRLEVMSRPSSVMRPSRWRAMPRDRNIGRRTFRGSPTARSTASG